MVVKFFGCSVFTWFSLLFCGPEGNVSTPLNMLIILGYWSILTCHTNHELNHVLLWWRLWMMFHHVTLTALPHANKPQFDDDSVKLQNCIAWGYWNCWWDCLHTHKIINHSWWVAGWFHWIHFEERNYHQNHCTIGNILWGHPDDYRLIFD